MKKNRKDTADGYGSRTPDKVKRLTGNISKPGRKKSRASPSVTTQENIASVLERISDGFVAFDMELNYTYVNERGGQLLGRKPKDLIGKNYWKEYPEAAGTPFANAYQRALKTQVSIRFEDYYEPWGRWYENRIHSSKDGLSIFFSDISERREHENKINYLSRLYLTLSQINQAIVRTTENIRIIIKL